MVTIDFKWSSGSKRWLRNVTKLPQLAIIDAEPEIKMAIAKYTRAVKGFAPVSDTGEPHIKDDWYLKSIKFNPSKRVLFRASAGSERSQDPKESRSSQGAFNVPWGIHDGIKKHKAWILVPSGTGYRVREKLAEFALGEAYHRGMRVKEIRDLLRSTNRPPWVIVGHEATEYAFGGSSMPFLHTLGDDILRAIGNSIGKWWSR